MPKGFRKDGSKLGFQKGHIFNNGRKLSKEHKIKISLYQKNRPKGKQSASHRLALSKSHIGKKQSLEHIEKRRIRIKLSWENEDIRKKRILHIKETKAKNKIIKKELIMCECGCNKIINKYDSRNRIRKVLFGHGNKGNKNWNWKGEITPIQNKIRSSLEYKNWSKSILVRDGFICQNCNQKGGKLTAHHIKEFAKYPELRFVTDNGITLCKKCHEKTDNYAGKKLNF